MGKRTLMFLWRLSYLFIPQLVPDTQEILFLDYWLKRREFFFPSGPSKPFEKAFEIPCVHIHGPTTSHLHTTTGASFLSPTLLYRPGWSESTQTGLGKRVSKRAWGDP